MKRERDIEWKTDRKREKEGEWERHDRKTEWNNA
jgi:hypothetical protein